jgi:tetratricopeptide (TPR) repeat protein
MISGWVYGNIREDIRQLKMALAVNPNYVDALILLAGLSTMSFGKLAAAIPLVQRVRQIDPLHPWNYWLQGRLFFFDGQYELAVEQFRQHYQLDPENLAVQYFYAWTLAYAEQIDEAFSIIDHSAQTAPDSVLTKFGLLLKYGLLKNREKAFREITPDFEKTCRRDHQWSYLVAVPLALVDAREESLDWLENAVERGFINYPELQRNRYLDNLRGEERFKKLMERVKYEWEHFEV